MNLGERKQLAKVMCPIVRKEPERRCHDVDNNDDQGFLYPFVMFPKASCNTALRKPGFSPFFRMMDKSKLFFPVNVILFCSQESVAWGNIFHLCQVVCDHLMGMQG